jgi:hypothetical protein
MNKNKSQLLRAAIFASAALALSMFNPAADAAVTEGATMAVFTNQFTIDYVSGSHPPL